MEDKYLPQSIELNIAEPISFPDEEELCRRLDEFYRASGVKLDVSPSQLFRGALYAIRREYSNENPDWMSQVAHSLREILYQFDRGDMKRNLALEQYGSTYDEKKRLQDVGRYYNFISDIAHHNISRAGASSLVGGSKDKPVTITREVFETVVFQFGKILYAVLRRQLDAHREIDKILEQRPDKAIVSETRSLINLNPDSRQYFFAKADEQWVAWLWENGFLDVIKQKAEDPTRYGYRTPEINYLVKVAEVEPARIVDIMIEVPISADSFNPEVVDRFLRISSDLPLQELKRVVKKIRDDKWPRLMGAFSEWGFEYEKMLKTLANGKRYEDTLLLAEAILEVRTKEEIEQTSGGYLSDNPFYFNDVGYTKVFEHLLGVDENNVEKALAFVTDIMGRIILWGGGERNDEVFKVCDRYLLLDVDFFTLELEERNGFSDRDNVKNLAAVIKIYAERTIGKDCDNAELAIRLYRTYFESLPDSRSMWRLRLFVLSLCPRVFKDELKKAFFLLFEVDNYLNLIMGTEYYKALRVGFPVLSAAEKHKYVAQVLACFSQGAQDEKDQSKQKIYGLRILSSICLYLTEEENAKCEQVFGRKCDPNYEPKPSIGKIGGGIVVPRGPVTKEEFSNLPIADIARMLRNEWIPEKLGKLNTSNDFLSPLNAEGAGELLRTDVAKRLQDYIDDAHLFFERDVLDQHYTYSFLRGVQEVIRGNRSGISGVNWDNLIALFTTIKESSESKQFDNERRERITLDAWLSGWTDVHSAMTDVLQELLTEHDGKIIIDFLKHRNQIFRVIDYLLAYPDPEPKDEELETAAMKIESPDNKEGFVSDPFAMAINTVRGRAFQAFVLFVYQDRKGFSKEEKIKIAPEVKELYEKVLKKEKTRALMFMFGHYLASFYFRDKAWINNVLVQIFPEESDKKHLYIAAWEGYLANSLYEEMFFDPAFQDLYKRGLELTGQEDPKRKYFKGLNEGIAIHLALAFVVYHKKFGFDHPLFKDFWKQSVDRQAEFVSSIGRMFVSGNNAQLNELLKKEPESRERLAKFWQWLLEKYTDPRLFAQFGVWMNLEKKIFEPAWLAQRIKETLKKTKGTLDWDYGLTKSIIELAKISPMDTLEISRLYLLEGGVRGGKMRMSFAAEDEWFETLKILYDNPEIEGATYGLINDLIREGGSMFWKLKDII